MKKTFPFVLVAFCFSACTAQPVNHSLQLEATIPLGNVEGRIDHITVDKNRQIIFIAALGNNSVEIIDIKNKKIIQHIKSLKEPQGVVFIPGKNILIAAEGENGECAFFNSETFQKIASIELGDDADNVRYDSAAGRIYVGYGSGGIAIIDAASLQLISKIKLPAHPESFQISKSTNRIYVNVPDAHLIEVIDLNKNTVVAQWKITEARANFPMALDEADHRLFIGCRHPSKLLVLDDETGNIISSIAIDGDADDIFYNESKKNIYISCGAGYIDVIDQKNADSYSNAGRVDSKPGARTSLFIPEFNSLIVAAPATITGNAELMIFKIK